MSGTTIRQNLRDDIEIEYSKFLFLNGRLGYTFLSRLSFRPLPTFRVRMSISLPFFFFFFCGGGGGRREKGDVEGEKRGPTTDQEPGTVGVRT